MPRVDFIADTSALVRKLRNDPSVDAGFAGKRFAITFVTLAELTVGVLKSRDPRDAWARVREVLHRIDIYLATNVTALIYAGIHRDLERRGVLIPVNDIWIAAMCIEAELPVLTRDAHFDRVPDLTVINC